MTFLVERLADLKKQAVHLENLRHRVSSPAQLEVEIQFIEDEIIRGDTSVELTRRPLRNVATESRHQRLSRPKLLKTYLA